MHVPFACSLTHTCLRTVQACSHSVDKRATATTEDSTNTDHYYRPVSGFRSHRCVSSMWRIVAPTQTSSFCDGAEGNLNYAAQHSYLVKQLFTFISWSTFTPPEKGAYCSVFAAAAPVVRKQAEEYEGTYLNADRTIGKKPTPSEDCYNEDLAKELWETTSTLLTELGIGESGIDPLNVGITPE